MCFGVRNTKPISLGNCLMIYRDIYISDYDRIPFFIEMNVFKIFEIFYGCLVHAEVLSVKNLFETNSSNRIYLEHLFL